jgi:hypothetical protein
MSRLSKSNLYAINWLYQEGKSSEFIAGELNLNIEQVNSAIEKAQINNKNSVKTGSEPVSQPPNMMINKTAGKGNSGVSIMTKEASEKHDAMRGRTSGKPNREDVIFRPRKNDK